MTVVLPAPYYQDDYVTLYHGDCRTLLDDLTFDVIVTDPPYGINMGTDYADRGRGRLAGCNNYPAIVGDDQPFDPAGLLARGVPTALFGANHYGERLPSSPSWIVWDKLDGLTARGRDVGFCDQADAELIWTNWGGPVRIIRHRWMGMLKAGRGAKQRREHPTEKPVEVLTRLLGLISPGTVLDPYAGSGSTLRAAKDLGRKAIGVEIAEQYCEVAASRLAQEVLPFDAPAEPANTPIQMFTP